MNAKKVVVKHQRQWESSPASMSLEKEEKEEVKSGALLTYTHMSTGGWLVIAVSKADKIQVETRRRLDLK